MQELAALFAIVAALTVGVISPGPSFIMVARVAIASSRQQGLQAALGMGAGSVIMASIALLGLQSVLLTIPALYLVLKVLGGLYLCYLGFLIFRAATQPLAIQNTASSNTPQAFWLGLLTQVSNPKTAIIYASVFAAFLPATFSWGFALTLLVVMFIIESSWYALVALVLSSTKPQSIYLSYKLWMDRIAGLVMFGLGLKLISSSVKP
ncbi:MAG: hypothetical protein RLZZ422_2899 [Pseudomonadota bacterium]|jgi:threonine/homoserine/homoserine lactone efflux protein